MGHRDLDKAAAILTLPIPTPVHALGGYGPDGEVIYESHPSGCPSILVAGDQNSVLTFMSNGSVDFLVKDSRGMDVHVLRGHFDAVEKHEIGLPSGNVWLSETRKDEPPRVASIMNPRVQAGLVAQRIRIVKAMGNRAQMGYGASFSQGRGVVETAVWLSFTESAAGPVLMRDIHVFNRSRRRFQGAVWTLFNLPGTQRMAYNKAIWYDAGLPLSNRESVVISRVPFSDGLQIKRVSSSIRGATADRATCDYTSFVGDTAATTLLPAAVLAGDLLPGGAGRRLNRFSTPTLAANRFSLALDGGKHAVIRQRLLYVTSETAIRDFRRLMESGEPSYPALSTAFRAAAKALIATTSLKCSLPKKAASRTAARHPAFAVGMPAEPALAHYANSMWGGVRELYEFCRAHGAQLADGIEIGARDRAQDMWPMMKLDPARVRQDLVYAFSLMIVTDDDDVSPARGRLSLRRKLHGMFPRQFPSRWKNRAEPVFNDNRPYADSSLWLVNALCMYLRETGDRSILSEKVKSATLTDPDHPETSAMVGCERTWTVAGAAMEMMSAFERHIKDSPYGLAQSMYGDWCDPIDMIGTSRVGDPATRGQGRGTHIRLSAHVFLTLVEWIDTLDVPSVRATLGAGAGRRLDAFKRLASRLREQILRVAWERNGPDDEGFLSCIHELNRNGSRPRYHRGEIGYTIGSMRGGDFDGVNRRDLTAQAYGLEMLRMERPYLSAVPDRETRIAGLLKSVDKHLFSSRLGYLLFAPPIANNERSLRYVGRMGVLPAGCAENGEYHHAQVFMHCFRLKIPGEADRVWERFKPVLSVSRDASIGGPFETPASSYASDPADPHFGKGMYFGLSGQIDWLVEIFQQFAGVELALHDERRPDLRVRPCLPRGLSGAFKFERLIHVAGKDGTFRTIPLKVTIRPGENEGDGTPRITINGRAQQSAAVHDLSGYRELRIEMTNPGVRDPNEAPQL